MVLDIHVILTIFQVYNRSVRGVGIWVVCDGADSVAGGLAVEVSGM